MTKIFKLVLLLVFILSVVFSTSLTAAPLTAAPLTAAPLKAAPLKAAPLKDAELQLSYHCSGAKNVDGVVSTISFQGNVTPHVSAGTPIFDTLIIESFSGGTLVLEIEGILNNRRNFRLCSAATYLTVGSNSTYTSFGQNTPNGEFCKDITVNHGKEFNMGPVQLSNGGDSTTVQCVVDLQLLSDQQSELSIVR